MAFKIIILSSLLVLASAGYIPNPSVDAVASTHQNVVRTASGTVSQYSKSIQTPYSSVHKQDTRINNNVYTPNVANTVTYAAPETTHVYTSHSAPTLTKTVYSGPQIHEEQNEHVIHASPAVPNVKVYTQSVPSTGVYSHSSPSSNLYSHVYAPAPAPTAAAYTHSTPTITAYHHEVPSTPTTIYNHGQDAVVYHQQIPAIATHSSTHNSASNVYHHEVPSTAVTKTISYHQAPTANVYSHEVPSTSSTTYTHNPAASTYSHNGNGVSAYGTSQTVHYSPAEMVSHMSFDGFGTHWGY